MLHNEDDARHHSTALACMLSKRGTTEGGLCACLLCQCGSRLDSQAPGRGRSRVVIAAGVTGES